MNLANGAIMGFLTESAPRILDNGLLQERLPISDSAADKTGNRSNPIRTNPCILDSEEICHIVSDRFEVQNTGTR